MADHTPGPWTLAEGEDEFVRTVLSTGPAYYIAAVYDTGYPAQNDPNARLIASAPDLLAALVQVLVEEGLPKASFGYAWDAIAKATGKEA